MIYLITIIILAVAANLINNYLSGRKMIKDLLHFARVKRMSLIKLDEEWTKNQDHSNIVVSLTTIPIRIEHIEQTIKSLLYQDRLPKKIYLNIPHKSFRDGSEYTIPKWLENLNALEIVRPDLDYGPSTKFIPTLERHDVNQLILVVDDDHLYPPNFIKEFEQAQKKQ